MNSCQDFQLLFLTLQANKKKLSKFFWHLKNSLAALHVNYEGKIKVFKKLLLSYISFLFTKILGEKKKILESYFIQNQFCFLEKPNTASLVQDYLSLFLSFLNKDEKWTQVKFYVTTYSKKSNKKMTFIAYIRVKNYTSIPAFYGVMQLHTH